ncbi:hypothetical protein ONZ45_g18178 [Pleurotus djamor]|nr:hypothetical protein ONZ45_g18178 [Pleurotus djamor]
MSPELYFLSIAQRTSYSLIAFACLLLYDHIITLSDEIQYVWSTPWGLGKLLFFLTRYIPYLDIISGVWRYMGPPTMSHDLCIVLNQVSGWICVAGLLIAEVIMVLRVWAIYNQSRKMGVFLVIAALTCIIIGGIMYGVFVKSTAIDTSSGFRELTSLRGCHFSAESNTSYISFLLLMTFEMLMLLLTILKGINDLGPKLNLSNSTSSFLFKFYQDAISLANVIVLVVADRHLAIILVSPQCALHSIFSARILLRLREDAHRRAQVPTLTAPVGESIFVTRTDIFTGVSRRTSWFGDARSNVVGGHRNSS